MGRIVAVLLTLALFLAGCAAAFAQNATPKSQLSAVVAKPRTPPKLSQIVIDVPAATATLGAQSAGGVVVPSTAAPHLRGALAAAVPELRWLDNTKLKVSGSEGGTALRTSIDMNMLGFDWQARAAAGLPSLIRLGEPMFSEAPDVSLRARRNF